MKFLPKYDLKMQFKIQIGILALFFVGVFTVNASTQKENFKYDALPFALKNIKESIVPIDMDGDGLKDLLCSKDSTISIYFQHKEGNRPGTFNFSKPDISIELPGESVGWDVDYTLAKQADNTDTSKRLVAIMEGKSVIAWSIQNRTFSSPARLLENLPGYLPKGAYPLNFIRDVNGDGRTDIVLPGNGNLHIYLQDEKGTYKGNIFINTGMGITSALTTPKNIAGKVGQTITIPAMTIRDVNNDGYNDVISNVDKVTEVFLGKTDGSFPGDPSYRIDLDSMTTPPKEFDWGSFDFSNIFSAISTGPQQYLQDLDGDKIEDLLLLDNGKITVYSGTSTGMDLSKPSQILRSSGNVILAFASVTQDKDKNESTKDAITTFINGNQDATKPKDLVLVRLQDLSVGDIFSWLVFSKGIDFDFFFYKNQGKAFEKRPSRKVTFTLKMPSALKLYNFMNEKKNSEKNPADIKIIRANISNTQNRKDRLILRDNIIQGFQMQDDIQIDQLDENSFNEAIKLFDSLGFKIKKDHYIMDVDKMMENLPELGNFELLAVKDKQPDFSIDITPYLDNTTKEKSAVEQSISAVDLNGDNRDDIFLFTDRDDTNVTGTLFLSR